MKNFNPLVCVMDPDLHTFQYVQNRSSFLLTVILAAASKAFNPALHETLQAHAEALSAKSFSSGPKTPETIQAFLLSTYWKQPDDSRSWAIIGYTIRLAMELGWHKFSTQPITDADGRSELYQRERRNMERTWQVLFVYDRR